MRKSEAYFLRIAASTEDLAAPVANLLRQRYPTLDPQTMIVAPAQEYAVVRQYRLFTLKYGQRTTPERTLIFGPDRLLVIEKIEKQHDSRLSEILIPFDQLVQVEMAMILLYSYVSFTWLADDVRHTLKIEYNSVGDPIIHEQLRRLWLTLKGSQTGSSGLSRPDWTAILNALPLKFGNYLQYALFPGEPLLQVIFQPKMNDRRRSRFAEDRALALTPEGLIVLEEARHVMHYGMILRYLPWRSIRRIRFEPTGDQVWLHLSSGAAASDEIAALPLSKSNAALLHEALLPLSLSAVIEWAAETVLSPVELPGSR